MEKKIIFEDDKAEKLYHVLTKRKPLNFSCAAVLSYDQLAEIAKTDALCQESVVYVPILKDPKKLYHYLP